MDLIEDHDADLHENPTRIKYLITLGNDKGEDIITYNQMLEYITQEEADRTKVWNFKRIKSHQGPLNSSHKDYKGSTYNVLLEWENGEITPEPLANRPLGFDCSLELAGT